MENQLYVALQSNKLFLDIDLEDMDLSDVKAELKPLKEGEILYREENEADHIYLVVSGEINLLKKKLLGSTKSFIFGENDFFGYDEIEENTSRTSTAVALRDSYLISLSLDDLQKLLERNHLIKTNLLNFSDIQPGIDESPAESEEVTFDTPAEEDPEEPSIEPEEEQNDKKADVTSFEQSLKDDLIDKHDTSIEEDISPYEEELKEDTYQKVHSDELPDDQVEKNVEETTQMPEPEEPLFPEDDEDEDENKGFEDTPAAETDEESPTLDEDTLKAIASQEESLTEQQTNEPEEDGGGKKLNDFDEAFYTAFHSEADEVKEDTHQEEETTLPEEPEQREDLGDNELKESDFSFEDDIKETTPEDSANEEKIENLEEEITTPAEGFPSDLSEAEEEDEEINASEEQSKEIDASEEKDESTKQTQSAFESKISSSTSDLQTDQLRKIIKASQLVNSNIKIDDVLQNVVTVATDLTNADRGTLYLIDRENNELWSKIAMGSETKEIRLKIGEGIAGWVAQNRETVNIEDVKQDERFSSESDKSSGYETKNMLCFPIKNRDDEIVGVLQLLNSKHGKFSEQDEEFLNAISIQCALALQNAEMLEQLLKGERVSSLGKMTNFLIQDIKKPVLVSKRYAEHLKSKDINKDAAQIVEMILDQLTQVADLVQTTSSYAEGKAVLRTSRVSFNEVINEFTDRLESFVKSKGSQVELNLGDDVKVQLDSKEFFQGYNHLIKNACDAMPDGGRIKVSTKADKNDVTLIVQDEGIGISENLIDKIFDPFMTHGKKEGTGLGLTITKKIIEGHSGTIEAESLLGEGSTIYIKLPKASAL